jgi:hypothetical protein
VAVPESFGGDALFGQAVGVSENMLEPFQGQALAGLAVRGSVVGRVDQAPPSLMRGLNLAEGLAAGGARVEDLPKKAQESIGKGEGALAAMGSLIGLREEVNRQKGFQEELELGEGQAAQWGGFAGAWAAELAGKARQEASMLSHRPYIYGS